MRFTQFKSALRMPLHAHYPIVRWAFIGFHQPLIGQGNGARDEDGGNAGAIHALMVKGVDGEGIGADNLAETALRRHLNIVELGCLFGRTMAHKMLDHAAACCYVEYLAATA